MSYFVMECHPSYVVLLDEEGKFLKAANLHYEVGQKVYNPVLMKEKPKKRPAIRWISSGIAAAAACLLLLFGISYYRSYMAPYSSIYLTINPEVQIDLNRQGKVTGLTGLNEDGEQLLEGYDGRGKDKVTAADELIDRAIEMGFLAEGGRIVFSIDSPDEALFQEYGIELRSGVAEHLDGQIGVTIEIVRRKNGGEEEKSPDNTVQDSKVPETELSSAPETAMTETEPSSAEETAAPETQPSSAAAPVIPETQPPSVPAPAIPETQPPSVPAPVIPETNPPSVPAPAQPPAALPTNAGDTDYGPGNDGATDYIPPGNNTPPSADSDYGSGDDGDSNYSDDDGPEED